MKLFMKNKNVIVSGFGFPLENLKFKTDSCGFISFYKKVVSDRQCKSWS